uniref:receptor protein-tyrosine kinase n=1 Tax=Romanomermis culicivorax TaxID=13658 RepID=A0A915I7T5_ROMCU
MADTIVLSWEEFNTSEMDHRMFLGYQVYYKAVDYENVSRFEDRDACSDSWKMIFYDINERGVLLNGLKADTLYAIYVSTSVKSSPGAKGGVSPLVYVRTKFETPSSVIVAKVESPDSTSIYIEWLPPEMPNGEITHYRIAYSSKSDVLTNERNYCDEPPNYSIREDKPLGFSDLTQETSINETSLQGTCSAQKCCECDGSKSLSDLKSSRRHSTPDDELINERAAFENCGSEYCRNLLRSTLQSCSLMQNKEKLAIGYTSSYRKFSMQLRLTTMFSRIFQLDYDLNLNERPKREAELVAEDQSSVFMSSTSMITTTTSAFTAVPLTTSSSKYIPFFGGETGRALLNLLRKPVYKPIESWPIHRNNTTNVSKSGDYYMFNVIWACQNTSAEENYCSFFDVMRLKRTQLNESAETINFTSISIQNISLDSHSESRFVKWDPPKSPNGFVVAYEIEYSRTSLSHSSQRNAVHQTTKKECILVSKYKNSSGIFLHDLLPGNYSVSVRAVSLAQRGPWTPPKYFYIPNRATTNYVMVLLIVITAIVALILLVFFFAFIYRKRWQRYVMKWVSGNPDYISQDNFYKADEWELKRESVKLGDIIGQGSFGVVYKGEGLNVTSINGITFGPCAVKTVAQGRDILDRFYFLNEATVMKAFSTAHIVKLLGVVSSDGPTWVIMEYMEQGNLKDFLLSRRPDDANTRALPDLTLTETLLMAAQISDGMAYLEAHKFTHRDLAARNCMVAVDGTCKIGDFGMARDIHYRNYYRPCGRRMMPVRWMSPEALKDATFSSKSDVWAFGVVLWEITTLGRQPYPGLSNEEVINYVVDQRQTLKIPENTPQSMIDIFTRTWKYDPKDRPTFDDLLGSLKDCGDLKFKQRSYWHTQREAILKTQEELNKEKQYSLMKNSYQSSNANPYELGNKSTPAADHDETMDEPKSAAFFTMSACADLIIEKVEPLRNRALNFPIFNSMWILSKDDKFGTRRKCLKINQNEQPVCNNNRRSSIIGWLKRFNPFGGDLSSSSIDNRSKKLLNSNVYRTTKGGVSLEC